jgi:hypothetical protein
MPIGAGRTPGPPRQRASFDNLALLWHGACAQGVAVAWLPLLVSG